MIDMTWKETFEYYYKKAVERGESEAEADLYAAIEADISDSEADSLQANNHDRVF